MTDSSKAPKETFNRHIRYWQAA